ncbi:TraR/DksA family transcriptional regulator [Agrococcus jejuensis]|uniref:RNA polymerase-binding transcription factor DksA n=1 Tax=Agrococcus jejuensis TaxID=399736 RepID=A0A1G8G251_9MICO|nr:TraR/DksA C4-type zinc finger protein [Agrococcus jejuensis]SDH88504.1 RNA polymerase-binding transcription factor DksA [Agrococcus jejuensis]
MEPTHAERIAAERVAAATRLASLEQQLVDLRALRSGESDDDEHDPDGVPLSEEWSRLEGLRESAVRTLAELDAAAAAAARGEVPTCVRCGAPIPAGRLAARPHARTCVECAA